MWPAEVIVRELAARRELWEVSPGLVGLRGDALALFEAIEDAAIAISREEQADEWRVPPGIALSTLARADYFRSFPQWLTAASHLSGKDADLRRVAESDDPATEARSSLAPADAALLPAVCYHCYARFAGTTLDDATIVTAQQHCWRHEGDRLAPLERGWAFTMREIVCFGAPADVQGFLARNQTRALRLAIKLGLAAGIVEAEDPFFAPTARGKGLLQRVKGLKRELVLPIGGGRTVAAASVNDHETFFGEAFEIRLSSGEWASSGCVAFGIERWLLAVLAAYGPHARDWPALPSRRASAVQRTTPRSVNVEPFVSLGGMSRC
jgi:hypothetical protein